MPEYNVWSHMRRRCLKESDPTYADYGGRGIRVCAKWDASFKAFIEDMGRRPSPKHTIERKNNDGHYCKRNCRWATHSEQARNRRSTRLITYRGVRMCAKDWADALGISKASMTERLKKWPIRKALSTSKVRSSQAKLTDAQVLKIRARRAAGETLKSISADFPVSFGMVGLVCARKNWTHI